MLDKLLTVGYQHYHFSEKTLSDLSDNCCCDYPNVSCLLVDFDEVKKEICKQHSLFSITSCDAIKICRQDGRIDFVEIKNSTYFSKVTEEIREKLSSKIKDSLYILETILNSEKFQRSKQDRESYKQLSIRYFIVSNTTAKEKIKERLKFYATHSTEIDVNKIENILSEPIFQLPTQPRLISCEKICEIICESNCCSPTTPDLI